jgi:hypothetical protein
VTAGATSQRVAKAEREDLVLRTAGTVTPAAGCGWLGVHPAAAECSAALVATQSLPRGSVAAADEAVAAVEPRSRCPRSLSPAAKAVVEVARATAPATPARPATRAESPGRRSAFRLKTPGAPADPLRG